MKIQLLVFISGLTIGASCVEIVWARSEPIIIQQPCGRVDPLIAPSEWDTPHYGPLNDVI